MEEPVKSKSGTDCARELVDWYWTYGIHRTTAQHVVSASWLDKVYRVRDIIEATENSAESKRPVLALWGPSQSGKSTLISGFVDGNADIHTARGGALDWGKPTVFSAGGSRPDDVVVLNPHHLGMDASGCVTRFVLRDDLNSLPGEHPVQIEFFDPGELLRALAAGYVSECVGGELPKWSAEAFSKLLDTYEAGGLASERPIKPIKAVFESMRDVVEVIERLIDIRDPRYSQLGANDDWSRSLRSRTLALGVKLPDTARVEEFAAAVLWDGNGRLTQLYNELRGALNKGPLSGGTAYCSMEVASVLLNIDSLSAMKKETVAGGAGAALERTRSAPDWLTWENRDGRILFGRGLATRLVTSPEAFGLLQGVVREIVVPLRRNRLSGPGQPLLSFLEKADIIDFPGVALADENSAITRINPGKLTAADDYKVYTEVLKRGKTATIVEAYGRSLGIDAFTILVRAGKFPSKPQQILEGLNAWWRSFDGKFDIFDIRESGRKPPLPLFLNLTFVGPTLSLLADGTSTSGWDPIVRMLRKLDPLVGPPVSQVLATTYPQFHDGKVDIAERGIDKIMNGVDADPGVARILGSNLCKASFREASRSPDGGVGNLFTAVSKAIDPAARIRLLESRRADALEDLRGLASEHSPGDMAPERRKAEIQSFISGIEDLLAKKHREEAVNDAAAWVGWRLRSMLDVDYTSLKVIPKGVKDVKLEVYCREQLTRWAESKRDTAAIGDLDGIDPAIPIKIVGYLADCVDCEPLARWIYDQFAGAELKKSDREELRRVLAVKISRAIFSCGGADCGEAHPPLTGEDGALWRLQRWTSRRRDLNGEDYRSSPHYQSVVGPVLGLLGRLKESGPVVRATQIGDLEVQAIAESLAGVV